MHHAGSKDLYDHFKIRLINYLFGGFVVIGLFPLFLYEKGEVVLMVNDLANNSADQVFLIITRLGNGYFWVLTIIVCLFIRYRLALTGLVILLLNALFALSFKHIIFRGLYRPIKYFEPETFNHLMEGYAYFEFNTFPSGHTVSAFSLAFFLAHLNRNRWLDLILFLGALLVGASRVYLLHHFYLDVYFGAIIGCCSYYLGTGIIRKYQHLTKQAFWDSALCLRKQTP